MAKLATTLGLAAPYVLADRDLAMYAILVVIVWKYFGFHMMLYIAGLQQIDPNLYEAAHIDGATGRQILWRVTLPLLSPTIRLSVFFAVLGSFQLFDLIMPLTKGGPSDGLIRGDIILEFDAKARQMRIAACRRHLAAFAFGYNRIKTLRSEFTTPRHYRASSAHAVLFLIAGWCWSPRPSSAASSHSEICG